MEITNKILTIFFSGWATDWHLIENKVLKNDTIVCYNYGESFDKILFSGGERYDLSKEEENSLLNFVRDNNYTRINIIAWSLGVYVVEHCREIKDLITKGRELPKYNFVAINGTPFPCNDKYGIPVSVFKGTLDNLSDRNLYKFRRRMCGENFDFFIDNPPQRSLESCKNELEYFYNKMIERGFHSYEFNVLWDKVYISKNDKIFPFENMNMAWRLTNTPIITIDDEHFSKQLLEEF